MSLRLLRSMGKFQAVAEDGTAGTAPWVASSAARSSTGRTIHVHDLAAEVEDEFPEV